MKPCKSIALAAALAICLASLACDKVGSSPTATMKGYFEALRKKDAEGLKKTVSKGSLQMFEQFAKAHTPPKTIDEVLQTGLGNSNTGSDKMPEMRDEKIEGDRATLQVKLDQGDWETILFVKEDGAWKIAFDEMLRKQSPRS